MAKSEHVLAIEDLAVHYPTERGTVHAVKGLSLHLRQGEILGLVGESGCGKSATLLATMRLLPYPGEIVSGSVLVDGVNMLNLDKAGVRKMRGSVMSMVFQDPMSALNPAHKVESQLKEAFMVHGLWGKMAKTKEDLAGLLAEVGIPSPASALGYYPHQLSGGMQQRVMIAIALACRPKVILADEPTTALDVTIEAQILDLLREINVSNGTAIVLVTHNLAIASQFCHRIAVMYAGRIVEEGPVRDVLYNPAHPYTRGLLRCIPNFSKSALSPIPGEVPDLRQAGEGCDFFPRCRQRSPACKDPDGSRCVDIGGNRLVRCFRWNSAGEKEEAALGDGMVAETGDR